MFTNEPQWLRLEIGSVISNKKVLYLLLVIIFGDSFLDQNEFLPNNEHSGHLYK
jgi:hypothetical protein